MVITAPYPHSVISFFIISTSCIYKPMCGLSSFSCLGSRLPLDKLVHLAEASATCISKESSKLPLRKRPKSLPTKHMMLEKQTVENSKLLNHSFKNHTGISWQPSRPSLLESPTKSAPAVVLRTPSAASLPSHST